MGGWLSQYPREETELWRGWYPRAAGGIVVKPLAFASLLESYWWNARPEAALIGPKVLSGAA